jgi:hypothetical protein
MPKNKGNGGCAGTKYGCCPDGVTAKVDANGSNCAIRKVLISLDVSATHNVIKHHKLYNNPLQSVGKIILSVESYIDKSIIFCKFKSNHSAKKNGFKSIEFKYTTLYKNYNNKQQQKAFDFVNRLPNLSLNSNNIRFLFVSNVLRFLSSKIVKYIVYKGITCNYFNMRINLPSYNLNYGILSKEPSAKNTATATSTDTTSVVDWINTNWYWPLAGAIAVVGAGIYKIFFAAEAKVEDSEFIEALCNAYPEADAFVLDLETAAEAAYADITTIATQVVNGLESEGVVFADSAAAVTTVEEDEAVFRLLQDVGIF